MIEQQHHEMVLDKTDSSGADEWYCPICGRRLLMEYEPEYKKTVLEAGDEYAIHTGGKGGVGMQPPKIMSQEERESENDPRLLIWSNWIDQMHLDDW